MTITIANALLRYLNIRSLAKQRNNLIALLSVSILLFIQQSSWWTENFFIINSTFLHYIAPPTDFFEPVPCEDPTMMGSNCDFPNDLCKYLNPCQNNGTCVSASTEDGDYSCSCESGFVGYHCEIDNRPCKPNTCLNHVIDRII